MRLSVSLKKKYRVSAIERIIVVRGSHLMSSPQTGRTPRLPVKLRRKMCRVILSIGHCQIKTMFAWYYFAGKVIVQDMRFIVPLHKHPFTVDFAAIAFYAG